MKLAKGHNPRFQLHLRECFPFQFELFSVWETVVILSPLHKHSSRNPPALPDLCSPGPQCLQGSRAGCGCCMWRWLGLLQRERQPGRVRSSAWSRPLDGPRQSQPELSRGAALPTAALSSEVRQEMRRADERGAPMCAPASAGGVSAAFTPQARRSQTRRRGAPAAFPLPAGTQHVLPYFGPGVPPRAPFCLAAPEEPGWRERGIARPRATRSPPGPLVPAPPAARLLPAASRGRRSVGTGPGSAGGREGARGRRGQSAERRSAAEVAAGRAEALRPRGERPAGGRRRAAQTLCGERARGRACGSEWAPSGAGRAEGCAGKAEGGGAGCAGRAGGRAPSGVPAELARILSSGLWCQSFPSRGFCSRSVPGSVFCQTCGVSAPLDISTFCGIRIFKLALLFLASSSVKKAAKTPCIFLIMILIVCFAAGGGA